MHAEPVPGHGRELRRNQDRARQLGHQDHPGEPGGLNGGSAKSKRPGKALGLFSFIKTDQIDPAVKNFAGLLRWLSAAGVGRLIG